MNRLKKGDKVRVISGSEKGKEGTIITVFPKTNKAIVEGVNIRKKHQKPNQQNDKSGIIDVTLPLDMSKLALIENKSKTKTTKVKFEYKNGIKKRGNKIRIAKITNNEIGGRK